MKRELLHWQDVHDALVNERVYKEAFTEEQALRIIRQESGKHFEPKIVELFCQHRQELQEIKVALSNKTE